MTHSVLAVTVRGQADHYPVIRRGSQLAAMRDTALTVGLCDPEPQARPDPGHGDWPADVIDARLPRSVLRELQARRRTTVTGLIEDYEVSEDRLHLPIGLASLEIERLSSTLRPEVIVMGAVKRGPWRRMILGSTAREVVPNLRCDLVALPPIQNNPIEI